MKETPVLSQDNHALLNKLFLIAVLITWSFRGFAQEITVSAAKPGGVYATGEKIIWRIGVKGEGANGITKINYLLKRVISRRWPW
jgi:hypothetical protein